MSALPAAPSSASVPPAASGGLVRWFRAHPSVSSWLLLLPGTLWMLVFVGIPLASIVLFSFWRSGFRGLVPDYNLNNYRDILTDPTFWKVTGWTLLVVAIVLAGVIVLAYPAAYTIWRVVKDERLKTILLLLCIIPFWTSYLTRTITWLPMFGRQGVVNSLLMALGIIHEPLDILLYTPFSMIFALWFLFIVFMIGPLYFSMSRIDEDILSAAAVFGAKPWMTFLTVILPLTRPGLMAGSLFVVVLGLAEFFTEQAIGGAQNPMLAGLIQRQVEIFAWSRASAIAVALVVLTLIIVSGMLRFFDIRKI